MNAGEIITSRILNTTLGDWITAFFIAILVVVIIYLLIRSKAIKVENG